MGRYILRISTTPGDPVGQGIGRVALPAPEAQRQGVGVQLHMDAGTFLAAEGESTREAGVVVAEEEAGRGHRTA